MASAIIEKDIAGNPKGVAVVEFDSEPARKVALTLSGAEPSLHSRSLTTHILQHVEEFSLISI